jgi:hypothetical protein
MRTVRTSKTKRISTPALWLVGLLLLLAARPLLAQDVPIISGAVGFLDSTNTGAVTFQPVLAPVVVIPLGKRLLVESRFDFRESYTQQNNTGPYHGTFFKSTAYLQLDTVVSSKLTFTAGRFLTPFGTYNERQSAIWIQRFQSAPIIAAIGTRTSGSSDGAMVRGVLFSKPTVQLNYVGYYSARTGVSQFQAALAAGDRLDLYFPGKRIEIGTSYARFLQSTPNNSIGTHFWWQPWRSPLQVRSEYAHGPHAQGYWMETSYRLSQWHGESSVIGRLEPVFRMQQVFRNSPGQGDGLPSADTKQADFGLDYHLPHEVRFNSNYSRKFSTTGNANIWGISLTYRFLFPVWRGKQ